LNRILDKPNLDKYLEDFQMKNSNNNNNTIRRPLQNNNNNNVRFGQNLQNNLWSLPNTNNLQQSNVNLNNSIIRNGNNTDLLGLSTLNNINNVSKSAIINKSKGIKKSNIKLTTSRVV